MIKNIHLTFSLGLCIFTGFCSIIAMEIEEETQKANKRKFDEAFGKDDAQNSILAKNQDTNTRGDHKPSLKDKAASPDPKVAAEVSLRDMDFIDGKPDFISARQNCQRVLGACRT